MMVVTLQRPLKPSNSLVKASLITCLDFRYRQIWPHSETVSCPLPNSELIVDVLGLSLLLLKNGLGSLDIFILEVRVLFG